MESVNNIHDELGTRLGELIDIISTQEQHKHKPIIKIINVDLKSFLVDTYSKTILKKSSYSKLLTLLTIFPELIFFLNPPNNRKKSNEENMLRVNLYLDTYIHILENKDVQSFIQKNLVDPNIDIKTLLFIKIINELVYVSSFYREINDDRATFKNTFNTRDVLKNNYDVFASSMLAESLLFDVMKKASPRSLI